MQTRELILQRIIELTKSLKIKSINVNGKIVDFRNVHTISTKDKIQVANKYINLLSEFNMLYLKEFFSHENNFNIITANNKYVTFNLTHHAVEQFIKRFIYIYLNNDKFEFSTFMKTIYNNYLDYTIDTILNLNEDTYLNEDDTLIELIKLIIGKSEVFNHEKSTGRWRDKLAFSRRENEMTNTIRYFNHPFMFVVQDNICKTVELYSSSQDCRHLNKFSSDTKQFTIWLKKKMKR